MRSIIVTMAQCIKYLLIKIYNMLAPQKQLLVELQKVRNIDMFKEKEDSSLTSVT